MVDADPADARRRCRTPPPFALEAIAESVESGSSYELQIVPATSVYAPQRVAGLIDMTRIELSLPVAGG